jgi:hypothetical protein
VGVSGMLQPMARGFTNPQVRMEQGTLGRWVHPSPMPQATCHSHLIAVNVNQPMKASCQRLLKLARAGPHQGVHGGHIHRRVTTTDTVPTQPLTRTYCNFCVQALPGLHFLCLVRSEPLKSDAGRALPLQLQAPPHTSLRAVANERPREA